MRSKTAGIVVSIALLAAPAAACAATSAEKPCDIDYAALKAEQSAAIEAGLAVYAREQDKAKWSDDDRAAFENAVALMERRDLVVDETDLAIIDAALAILSDEALWDRADDRQCDNDNGEVSLFCALARASVEVAGEYAHRRTALQEVRFAVAEASAGKDYAHRMMDYNNDPETTFDDIRQVLMVARDRVAARLDAQARCGLSVSNGGAQ